MTRDEVRALADMETHGINVAASTARDLARQLLEALDRAEAAETGRDTKAAARLGPVATVPECGDDAAPACPSCGVAYRDHLGLIGTCAALRAAKASAVLAVLRVLAALPARERLECVATTELAEATREGLVQAGPALRWGGAGIRRWSLTPHGEAEVARLGHAQREDGR